MRHVFLPLLLAAGLFAAACSDGDGNTTVGPTTSLSADDIVVNVDRDVRNNLTLHFRDGAAKAPVQGPEIHIDFLETSRTAFEGEGTVIGDFIYYADRDEVRHGQIAIHYRQSVDRWLRTGLYEVAEGEPVASHIFAVTVRDAATGRPVPSAEVQVRRVGSVPAGAVDRTDDQGHVSIEVLPGVFEVRISRDDYRTVTTDRIATVSAVQDLNDVRLVPLKQRVRVL